MSGLKETGKWFQGHFKASAIFCNEIIFAAFSLNVKKVSFVLNSFSFRFKHFHTTSHTHNHWLKDKDYLKIYANNNKNKIYKHAKIDRHLEFVIADFYIYNQHTDLSLRIVKHKA